jgi:hypothetical protein
MEGMKLIRRLARVPPLSDYLTESDVPEHFDNLSDEQLSAHIDKCEYSGEANGALTRSRFRDYLPPTVVLQDR